MVRMDKMNQSLYSDPPKPEVIHPDNQCPECKRKLQPSGLQKGKKYCFWCRKYVG